MSGTTGLVPTMGALHDGHLALVRRARAETGNVVLSIFVNPTQFASNADVSAYPRTRQRDLELAEREGVDVVFMPEADELYPEGFSTFVEPGPISEPLEGASRPGHFRGVATVVLKLLNIVQPTHAYFGWKDAQQLLVIRRMVHDLNVPVEIIGVETVREGSGLAMSSRNLLLSPAGLQAAGCVSRALYAARDLWQAGERDAETLREAMRAVIRQEPLARIDYVSIADARTLLESAGPTPPAAIASLAVTIEGVRLIDNMRLVAGN